MTIYTLTLLGSDNIQNRILSQFVKDNLNQVVRISKCELLLAQSCPENSLLLIDVNNLDEDETLHWQNILASNTGNISTILLNTDDFHDKQKILRWPNCCGVFANNTPLKEFIIGMEKILNGEYWLPRSVMTELLQHYRTDFKPSAQPTTALTSRELDVLALLPTCKSNIEIADILFVSEHTVKSHLYKVFKKIDVKNRLQAMSWVKENLQ